MPCYLFSHKGLKCVSSPVGKFVKLHPFTERCTRLDVARLLLEVNFHEPLVESVKFTDREGSKVEVAVSYPWLQSRCNICSRWGHKGSECTSKQVVILSKTMEDKPVDDNHVGADHGVQVEEISENVVEGEVNVTGNSSVGALLAELEALPVSKLANGVVAYQLANAVEVIELEAGKMNEGGENQGCKEIPSRNLPSLDDPEVVKTSFDVASASDCFSVPVQSVGDIK